MSLPDKCPFCGAAIAIGDDGKKRVADLIVIFDCGSGFDELIDPIRTRSRVCKDITRLAARVAELEALVREAEESNANALARLSAAEATIELRRIENEAVRHQVWHAENVCDAMEKRVFDTDARCKRLEDAARAVYLDSIASDHPWTEPETRNMRALRDALEAKP